MNLIQAALLGFVQGLTEFLPVSSSAHLVLFQSFMPGFTQPGLLFDVVLHGGTLVAVIWYFRKHLLNLSPKMASLLILGTIPAGLAGVFLNDFFEGLFTSTRTLGYELIFTGFINLAIDRWQNNKQEKKEPSFIDSLIIGIFQAIAIIPGISRSGATIFGALFRGVKKEDAAIFSFLLSIPAIGGAIVLEAVDVKSVSDINLMNYLVGFIISLIVGYLSIKVLLRFIVENKFKYFAYYCFALGALIILNNLRG